MPAVPPTFLSKKLTGALSSTACAYTLVPITKNNFGLPTFQKMDFRSLLRDDFPTALLVRLSPSCELADNSTNVLVPINAFDCADYTQVLPVRQEDGGLKSL
jgi:hypothetical protein